MTALGNKHIVVVVTGGIAAYKSPDLVRRLREQGASVRVVMTTGGAEFITPLTLQAVSGNPVHDSLLDHRAEAGMGHIELARWADLVVVAPASANTLARLAHGLADDLLSTLCLATEAPIALAPAMNRLMWSNASTQRNVDRLREDGRLIIGPDSGEQACGELGAGRMSEPTAIVAALGDWLDRSRASGSMSGRRVLITAGPTFEALDPVRGMTNKSSGKMGYALATAAYQAGAEVTLVSGPTALASETGVSRIDVVSAAEMYDAVHENLTGIDVFIGVAAVADYRPKRVKTTKMKKTDDELTVEFVRNPDILSSVAGLTERPYTIGFAAETNDVVANARQKLMAKKLDLICANRVGAERGGFSADENALTLIDRSTIHELPMGPKDQLAKQLIDIVAERLDGRNSTQSPRQTSG